MNEVVKILVIEKSYIIREGLKALLSQMGLAFRMDEADCIKDSFQKLLEKYEPQVVIANQLQLSEKWHGNRNSTAFTGLVIIGIVHSLPDENQTSHFDFTLNVMNSKSALTNDFQDIFVKIGLVSEENDSETISEREADVLRLVALGLTNNEIAERLFISVHTVMTHRKNITRKLGIKTVSGLTVYAILNKLVESGELKGGRKE